jgi:hypothetical protein
LIVVRDVGKILKNMFGCWWWWLEVGWIIGWWLGRLVVRFWGVLVIIIF